MFRAQSKAEILFQWAQEEQSLPVRQQVWSIFQSLAPQYQQQAPQVCRKREFIFELDLFWGISKHTDMGKAQRQLVVLESFLVRVMSMDT